MKEVYEVQITFYDDRKYMPKYFVTRMLVGEKTKRDLYIRVTRIALDIMQSYDYLLLKEITILD